MAALDLSSGDELTDFLNNMRPSDGAPARVQQPGQPPAGSSSGGQPPIPPIPVPRADLPDGQATPASLPLGAPPAAASAPPAAPARRRLGPARHPAGQGRRHAALAQPRAAGAPACAGRGQALSVQRSNKVK